MRQAAFTLLLALMVTAGALPPAGAVAADDLKRIRLPAGFAIEIFAMVRNARSLVIAEDLGAVFVGTRGNTLSAVILDPPRGGGEREIVVLGRGFNVANGIARKGPHLFVAEQHRVVRYRIRGRGRRLYVAVGAPCNVCVVRDPEGTIVRLKTEDGPPEVYARGIRNSVGMAFHPSTGQLFFTDNGSDNLGDDVPANELNHAPGAGLHFGFPVYGGGHTRTPDFARRPPPPDHTPPAIAFAAHTASLGIHFYTEAMFPPQYRGDAFVAQHGSWNRSTPIGYRVMRIRFGEDGRPVAKAVFADG